MTRQIARFGLVAAVVLATGLMARASTLETAPLASAAAGAPRFLDETGSSGVVHAYDGEFTYFVGGGVAVLDCDGDGRPDLFFAGGAERAALFRNGSERGGPLTFDRVPAADVELTEVTGAYPLDFDADSVVDLAVLRVGENVLLRGTGDCAFERANERWEFDGGDAWTTAFSATWEDDMALPTLAFGNYLVLADDGRPIPSYSCDDNQLFRPGDDRRYAPPVTLDPGWCTLSLLFSDWDRSGRRDLRVSNDRHYYTQGEEQLWLIEPGEEPRLWTNAEGWQTLRIWGMGIASHDLTGDGYPEVYLTSQSDNKLQTLRGDPSRPEFGDIAITRGVTAHRPYAGDVTMRSTAWHPEFDDVNNDGLVDLFVSKGNIERQADYAARDPSNLLIGQPDGTFVEGAPDAGIVSFARARGAALADLNLDGLLDLVVVNRRENVGIYRNVGAGTADEAVPMGSWIAVRLHQPGANRDGIGARIEVRSGGRVTSAELTIGGGHASGELGWLHFGLGDADSAELRVTWPDGEVGGWQTVEADGFLVVERSSGEVRRQPPGEAAEP